MKNSLIFIFLLTFSIITPSFSQEQPVTLHSGGNVTHFRGISAFINAYNASLVGDTIYLGGSTYNPPATINKKLVIIGAGHYPDSTTATGKTYINGAINLGADADQLYMEGFDINTDIGFASNQVIDQVILKRLAFNSLSIQGNLSLPVNNLTVSECVIKGSISIPNAQTVLVSNCIIVGTVSSSGCVLRNNVFIYNVCGTWGDYSVISGNNNIFINNVFKRTCVNIISGTGNVFQNNITVYHTPGLGTNASSSDNYLGVAETSIFINQTGTTFSYQHDYHLQAPATYLGDDDTQVGIYGGQFPYKNGVPSNPHIFYKNVSQQTNASGQLNIQFKVRAQEN